MKKNRTQRTRAALLFGAGAAVGLIALLILESLVGGGLFSTKTTTVTVSTSDAYKQVSDAYAYHLMQLNHRNISAIVGGYESNATAEWTGARVDLKIMLGVNASGSANITLMWDGFIGKFSNFSVSNEYQSIGAENDNISVVNSTFDFRAYNVVVGNVNGSVIAQDTYKHLSGSLWLIATETWNFTQFNEQFPTAT